MSLANDLHQEPRRSFLKVVTGILAGMLGAVTALPGLALLLHPAARETVRGGRRPLRVASLRELKPGRPLRVDVRGELVDAWSRIPDVKLGSCWLVREPGPDGQGREAEAPARCGRSPPSARTWAAASSWTRTSSASPVPATDRISI